MRVTVINTLVGTDQRLFASYSNYGGCFEFSRPVTPHLYCYEHDWAKTRGEDVERVFQRDAHFEVAGQGIKTYNRVSLTAWNIGADPPNSIPWVVRIDNQLVYPTLIGIRSLEG